ncbi:MAG TPA: cell envelope biogenesis protein OmpA [Methylothermaceae bacterium]|nr:cell envelope biogenesis protein OmpA [Methylothermaceae bacterium]
MRKAMILIGAGLVAGCTTNPYTGQQQVSKTVIGTGVGAATGAALGAIGGAIAGNPGKGAAIGAGVGALAGMGVGAYMDRQEAILRQKLAGTGVRVVREGNNLRLIMPGNITFATNSAEIAPQFYSTLNAVALVLKEFPETLIEVTGHTDSTGSEEYNLQLSQQRANSVAQYLIAQGIAPNRILAKGMGESMPIAPNDTPEGRAANRRVEIRIQPMTRQ